MHSFAGLIRRTPPPTFSDTAITDSHSDTTLFPAQSTLGADILVYWIGKIVRTCAPGGSRTLDFLRARRAPYPLGQALRLFFLYELRGSLIYVKVGEIIDFVNVFLNDLDFCGSLFMVSCLFPRVMEPVLFGSLGGQAYFRRS